MSFCHHLASVVRCKLFLSSSSLKPLGQFEPNFARMVLEWPPFKIICDSLIILVKGLTRGPKREINLKKIKIDFFRTSDVSCKDTWCRTPRIQNCINEGNRIDGVSDPLGSAFYRSSMFCLFVFGAIDESDGVSCYFLFTLCVYSVALILIVPMF